MENYIKIKTLTFSSDGQTPYYGVLPNNDSLTLSITYSSNTEKVDNE